MVVDVPAGARVRVSTRGAEGDLDLHVHRGRVARDARDGDVNADSPSPDEAALRLGGDAVTRHHVLVVRPAPWPEPDLLLLRVEPVAGGEWGAGPWSPLARRLQHPDPALLVPAYRAHARGDVTGALALVPGRDAEADRLRARWLAEAERWAEAREVLGRLPSDAETRHLRATCAWGLGEREVALAAWTALVAQDGRTLVPRLAAIDALLRLGRCEEARGWVADLLRVDPELDLGPTLQGACSSAPDALAALERALAAPDVSPLALRLGAEALGRGGAPARAAALLDAAAARARGLPVRLAALRGRALVAMGRQAEGRTALLRLRARAVRLASRVAVEEALDR